MKILKSENGIRDFIFFVALIAITNAIIERNGELYERQLKNLYAVHEVNPEFGRKIRQTVKQLDALSELMPAAEMDEVITSTIASLKTELLNLKEQYETNSPALFVLGPIGTTSIVLKEAELEQKLLKTLNETGKLITSFMPRRPGINDASRNFEPAPSIEVALNNNINALGRLNA
jgi:hypothetical protein